MQVARIPLRVSLFGGGTDYPAFFNEYGGCCLSLAIDKYIYITMLDHSFHRDAARYRLSYSAIEETDDVDDIRHPAIKEALKLFPEINNVELSILSDMPAGTGLGSSSAFCVGLLGILNSAGGRTNSKQQLAENAIRFEQETLRENVGVQDQISASFGGLNTLKFDHNGFSVLPVDCQENVLSSLTNSMLLINSNVRRRATDVAKNQVERIMDKSITTNLLIMKELVADGERILRGQEPGAVVADIGRLLNEAWALKKSFSDKVSNDYLDGLLDRCIDAGAMGGKLLGAGAGGFFLAIVAPERQKDFLERLSEFSVYKVGLDQHGASFKDLSGSW